MHPPYALRATPHFARAGVNPALAAGGVPIDRRNREPVVLLGVGLALLAWSGLRPHDYFTWLLEAAPILIGVPILIATRRRFPLTPLAYLLVLGHAPSLLA